jgi:hypothetical protein
LLFLNAIKLFHSFTFLTFSILLFIDDRAFDGLGVLRCFAEFAGTESELFDAAENILVSRVVKFGRAAQNP